jgi:hypothetical protein
VLQYGTQKCKAAPRGDGKSSIVKYLALKYALARQVRFPLITAATSSKAKKILSSLKRRLASRADTPFSQDYPLECHVARYVDPWPSRARNVTANGQRVIHVEWGADWFVIPTWERDEPLGPILLSLGITSDDLQGCNIYDQRPDFVMLDDLDSRDSLASAEGVVAGKIEETVDKSIAGLGGQGRRLGKFMLCTITSRDSAAYKYSDPQQKPSWAGERIAAIIKWPDRKDLWEEYVRLRNGGTQTLNDDFQPVDVFGREAHRFYLAHQSEMDAGADLANPFNFDSNLLPDGTPKQISALQRCYDYIADEGMNSFLTEHQNDPPEDEGKITSGISKELVRRQVSGVSQKKIPDGCTVLAHASDVGKTKGFHWQVRAYKPDGTFYVIDYGIMDVRGTKYGSDEGLDRAIYNAVRRRHEEFLETQYAFKDGEVISDPISVFDSRYRTDAVMRAVKDIGLGVYAIKGIGTSAGTAVRGKYHACTMRTQTRKPGIGGHFYYDRDNELKLWALHADTDYWKAWEHDRWLTATDKPGCGFLWGGPDTPAHQHDQFAKHICAEIETEEIYKGVPRRLFVPQSSEMDWLDTGYYCDVLAAMKGVRIISGDTKTVVPPDQRPSARDLAARK